MNNGIALACTGVMRSKPILEMASSTHSDSPGVSASQALAVDLSTAFGAPFVFACTILLVLVIEFARSAKHCYTVRKCFAETVPGNRMWCKLCKLLSDTLIAIPCLARSGERVVRLSTPRLASLRLASLHYGTMETIYLRSWSRPPLLAISAA